MSEESAATSEPTNLISDPIPGVDKRYGGLIKGGDARKGEAPTALLNPPAKHVPRGRPAMRPAVEKMWDKHQEEQRKISVRVVCVPPARKDNGEPFDGYWCAKRFWRKGLTECLVSPHELLELQSEGPQIIEVIVLSGRQKAYSVPGLLAEFNKEAKKQEDFQEKLMNGELSDEEIAALHASEPVIHAPSPSAPEPVKTAPTAQASLAQDAQGVSAKAVKK